MLTFGEPATILFSFSKPLWRVLSHKLSFGKIIFSPYFRKNSCSILCYYNLWFTSGHILGQELVSISNVKKQVEGLVWLWWFSKRLASLIYLPYRTIQELLSIFEIMIFVLVFTLRRRVTTWSITSLLAKHLWVKMCSVTLALPFFNNVTFIINL